MKGPRGLGTELRYLARRITLLGNLESAVRQNLSQLIGRLLVQRSQQSPSRRKQVQPPENLHIHPCMTNDLHVRIATNLHQSFL